jgi:hypothetical protein
MTSLARPFRTRTPVRGATTRFPGTIGLEVEILSKVDGTAKVDNGSLASLNQKKYADECLFLHPPLGRVGCEVRAAGEGNEPAREGYPRSHSRIIH